MAPTLETYLTDPHPILRPARLYAASIEPGYLCIDNSACQQLASQLSQLKPHHWLSALWQTPDLTKLQLLTAQDLTLFLTIFHTIGFCYWPSPRWTYQRGNTVYDGTAALLRSLCDLCVIEVNSHADASIDQTSSAKAQIDRAKLAQAASSLADFQAALGGNNTLPLMSERYQFFKTIIDVQGLLNGTEIIERLLTKEVAMTKVFYIKNTLPGFDDTATVQGFEAIPFLKRAQLLTSDIDYILGLTAPNSSGLEQINSLTAFADYKVPQILRHNGVLNYGKELSRLVDKQVELAPQSRGELAIRVFTLLAVEQLRSHMPGYTAGQIDNMLWSASQITDNVKLQPYHRTICTNY